MLDLEYLDKKALWVRRKVLEMATHAKSGHISTAYSQCEILVSLYYGGVLRIAPADPKWEKRDRFILSKGQGGIGLYPILADVGYFPLSHLDNFCGKGSKIGVHAESHCPGVEILSGSLGHGPAIATGMAIALKQRGSDSLVYCLCGDGELGEGSCWESFMFTTHHKLNNIVFIIDRNGQNTLGKLEGNLPRDGVHLEPLADKFKAFGFIVHTADGHDFNSLLANFDAIRENTRNTKCLPQVLIANTKKGKGCSLMEDQRFWHYRVPSGNDLDQCWDDLGGTLEQREASRELVKDGQELTTGY